ncbi:MAG: hypothetical protein Q8M08_08240 [Bacteroidales bacterium]|nr:hypothetical protein [Bacteroidales bacterium]
MKRYIFILISVTLLLPFTGCKKKSFDPTSKSREDFAGIWKGSISTFKSNKLLKEYGTVVIYSEPVTQLLTGILFMKETNIFREFQFVDGTLYFKVDNNDPASPLCQNWNLGGFAVFSEEGIFDIHITGNECGQLGSEFVNWVGSMTKTAVAQDSVKYYSFVKSGNSWTYKVTQWNGDSCEVQKQATQISLTYLTNGTTSQTCGWSGQSMTFTWNVSPSAFKILNDSSLCTKPFTFPINAKLGVVYSTYVNNDTTTVTLVDSNLVITTPAGVFPCSRFKYTEPVYSGGAKIQRTSYIWLNNLYGIIKHQVQNPVDLTDIQYQVLISKNF